LGQISLELPVFIGVEPVEHGLEQVFHGVGPFAILRQCKSG
jgi:hypothetical protein